MSAMQMPGHSEQAAAYCTRSKGFEEFELRAVFCTKHIQGV
jgi:hypothetical protein